MSDGREAQQSAEQATDAELVGFLPARGVEPPDRATLERAAAAGLIEPEPVESAEGEDEEGRLIAAVIGNPAGAAPGWLDLR